MIGPTDDELLNDDEQPKSRIAAPGIASSMPAVSLRGLGAVPPASGSTEDLESRGLASKIAPAPVAKPSALQSRTAADEAELARKQETGSGISQIHNPVARYALRGLETIGNVIAPLPTTMIPGTEAHHQYLMAQDRRHIGQDVEEQGKEAQTEEAQARTNLADQQAAAAGQPKAKEEKWTPFAGFTDADGTPLIHEENSGQVVRASDRQPPTGFKAAKTAVEKPDNPEQQLIDAEAAVAGAKTPEEKTAAQATLAQLKRSIGEFAALHAPPRNDQAAQDAIEAAAKSIASMDPHDLTRLRDIASLRGDQRLLIYNRAKQINPNFSGGTVDRRLKMLDEYTNGKEGQQLQSFGTFLEHAGEASRVTNEFRTTSIPLVNTPLNKIRDKFGDATYTRLAASLEPVRKEFEGFLLGGRALYGDDRKAAETILSDNASPAQIQAALKQMGHTVKARYNEMNSRFKNGVGANIEEVVGPLSDEAREGARQVGVEMGGGRAAVSDLGPAPAGKAEGATGSLPDGTKVIVKGGRLIAQ